MRKLYIVLLVIVLSLIIINVTVFTIDEKEQCVILQFGKPIRTIQNPGIHIKVPYPVQSTNKFEDRILDYDSAPTEILTKDKKNLVLDNYAKWRISDPLKFLQTVGDENGASSRLDDIIYSELRVELGKYDLIEIVASHREQIMEKVTENSNTKALEYGIKVIDVRIKRADLPQENEKAVFERMRAERKRQANKYRSEGAEEALKITAQTDKEKVIILAEAYEKSEKIKGEGDGEAIKIYAEAYERSPEFYEFFRTLEAYEKTLKGKTTLLLSSENEFMKFIQGINKQ